MKQKNTFVFSITLGLGIALLFLGYTQARSAKALFEDFDQDGLSNEEEVVFGTDPYKADSDGDGYGDYTEVSGGYDPLKPAPGDRLVQEKGGSPKEQSGGEYIEENALGENGGINATQRAAAQLAGLASDATEQGEAVTLDSVESLVKDALEEANKPIELPEIDDSKIKVLEQKYEDLSEEERNEREKEDAITYLSSLAYIFASNSPQRINLDSQDALMQFAQVEISQMISSYSQGNYGLVQEWAEKGDDILDSMEEIEVPEQFIDIHKRGLQIIEYGLSLEEVSAPDTDDPIGNISKLAQAQGFMALVGEYQSDIFTLLEDLGIEEIPFE